MHVKDVGRCWLISFKKKWEAKIDEAGICMIFWSWPFWSGRSLGQLRGW